MRILVVGAGGFIGGHLTKRLEDEGHYVDAVDIKPLSEWYQLPDQAHNRAWSVIDVGSYGLPSLMAALVNPHYDEVYNLAADMGGMGFIENNKAACMLSVKTSLAVLETAKEYRWDRVFFSSSACVYPSFRQDRPDMPSLAEEEAYPADPEDGYGWEKLFSERLYRHYAEDYGIETRIGRYHNVYGPFGAFQGGREKAPAAICRKVATAALTGENEIEIWGDGEQTRSFMYVDDCTEGTIRLMRSDVRNPLNVGSAELVTINRLVSLVEDIAGNHSGGDSRFLGPHGDGRLLGPLVRKYNLDAPQGVRGRNSDNTLIKEELGWEPSIELKTGLERTYAWIYDRVKESL